MPSDSRLRGNDEQRQRQAHQHLDKAVDAAYLAAEKAAGRKPPRLGTNAERVAFLFERYQALTSLLPADTPKRRTKPKSKAADSLVNQMLVSLLAKHRHDDSRIRPE